MLSPLVGLTSIHGSTSAPGKFTPEPSGGQPASGVVADARIRGPAVNGAARAPGASKKKAPKRIGIEKRCTTPPIPASPAAAGAAQDATPIADAAPGRNMNE